MRRWPEGVIAVRPHAPAKRGHLPWLVCARCGLIYLKNAATRAAAAEGCFVWKDEVQS